MHTLIKYTAVLMVLSALIIVPFGMTANAQDAFSEEKTSTPGLMLVDLCLARPGGLGAMIVGGATWIVSLPFTAISGDTKYAFEKLVKEPTEFTFNRRLGFF